jgi:putative PIN family toxin of toxin-antitoxin system
VRAKIVIDTNVLIGALIGKQYSANRQLIELCLQKKFQPLINNTLFCEYEEVFNRKEIISKSPYSEEEGASHFCYK